LGDGYGNNAIRQKSEDENLNTYLLEL
jgi:hypothetical protein